MIQLCQLVFVLSKMILSSFQMQAPGEARKDSSAKARNFLKALKDKHSLFWLHFMLDVVQSLSTVSRTVQSKDSNLGDVYNEIEACKAILGKYMNRYIYLHISLLFIFNEEQI